MNRNKFFLWFFLMGCMFKSCFSFSQSKITTKPEFPILGWYSIPPEHGTVARYEEMRDAGFTISFSFLYSPEQVQKTLDTAQKAGLKVVIGCPELKSETDKIVRRFMHHPALAGYFLRDEPGIQDFPTLGDWARKVRAIDSLHFCYVNLFPNYANATQLGSSDYREYVERFAKEIPLEFLSFDSYPLTSSAGIFQKWHQNLEIIASEATKAGKSFWGFAQSVLFDNTHESPTLATLRLQQYTNLAYGAQGLQYFTYWTPVSSAEDFRGAPLSLNGRRSSVYDYIKILNREIKALSKVFLGAKLISVEYLGKEIPKGTKRLSVLPPVLKLLETAGKSALVSHLENKDRHYILIVNNDYQQSMRLTLLGDDRLNRILKDGTAVPLRTYDPSFEVEPGDLVVLEY